MDSLSISARLDVADWRAYQRACAQRLQLTGDSGRQQLYLVGFAFVVATLMGLVAYSGVQIQMSSFLAGGVLFALAVWYRSWLLQRRVVPDATGVFLAPQTIELTSEGLHSIRSETRTFTSWALVESISITPEHIFIWIDRFNAHIVPLRDLPVEVTAEQLRVWLEARVAQVVQRPPAAARGESRPLVLHWPMTLLNLLVLRRVDLPPRASVATIAVLGGALLIIRAVIDWLTHQPDPEFFPYALPAIGWYALMLLGLAAILTFRSFPQPRFSSALALILATAVMTVIVVYLIERFTKGALSIAAIIAACMYLGFAAWRGFESLTGRGQPRAFAFAVALLVLFQLGTSNLYVDPSLWVNQEDDETETAAETDWSQAESLLFSQSGKIDEAIDALATPGDAPAAFFVGFAGVGEQRVFAEEIKLAAAVMGARYGSDSRNVLLVNDQRDLNALPLASPTALRYALRGVASRMNLDRDVLFLSLSSHGSEDATISVSNGSLMLQDLGAEELAAALDESGIKWRVIVVSACYSGAFIKPLSNPQTIVITASSADRTSFGCSNDRDLTYFGEAFYRDALPKATSLRNAYEVTRDSIKRREQKEGITASRPQAFFGQEIEARVEALSQKTKSL